MRELLRGQIAVANKMMAETKINLYRGGNISSVDRLEGIVVFKPDEVSLAGMTAEKTLVVSLIDGQIQKGDYDPLPDMNLHLEIYRNFPQISSIAHVYPQWVSTYAQSGRSVPVLSKNHAVRFKNKIPCTPELRKVDAVSDLYQTVTELLHHQEILERGAILIRYDGALVWDTTPLKALDCARALEQIVKTAWQTEILGGHIVEMPSALSERFYFENLHNDQRNGKLGVAGNQVTAKDQRKINLELLAYFDQVCRANNIKYSLTGGTLLGAVRHRGFIPWDDDVDVFMPRPEYEKLTSSFDDKNRFVFINREKESDFNYVFGRLIDTKTLILESPNTVSSGKGLFLDICVVDGLPNHPFFCKLHIAYMRLLVRARRATIQNPARKAYRRKGPLFLLFKNLLRAFTTYQFWNRLIERAMNKYPFEGAEFVGNFTSQYGKREKLHRSVFDDYIDLPFEGHPFMVCAGYEEYLTNIYGRNYMNLPPKEKRKGHHPNKTIWVD